MAIKNLRWWVAGLLALATALNYLDRQTFPVLIGEIKHDIPISDGQYGQLTSVFLFAYAVMYAGGGRLMDWLGTRRGYALMIAWWSAANFLLGTVNSVLGLGVFRFLLGMGEGGGIPGSAKAVAEWFPARERSMAFGVFNTGSSLGAMIAPPAIAVLVSALGWRPVFFITGGLGLVWAAGWIWLYRVPGESRWISAGERELIVFDQAVSRDGGTGSPPVTPWLRLFGFREVRGLMAAKFFSDAAWFFFIFWLPKYLGDVRHLDIQEIGYFAWIPYAFSGTGCLGGGWLGTWLIRRRFSLNASRKITMGIGAALVPASLFIVAAPLHYAIVFFSVALFAHQFWSSGILTLPSDFFPANAVGSVSGLVGSAGSFGGMVFGLVVGWLVGRHGYGPVFLIAGLLHPLSFAIILVTSPRIGPLLPGSDSRPAEPDPVFA